MFKNYYFFIILSQLRGTDPFKYRRERVVNDKQPCVGYMHSGYPIVTHLDICMEDYNEFMFDINKLRKDGCWYVEWI
jgi:hypothetical protein